ncbi:MAG: hypothetical protein IT363_05110 [Methanoregulaceae archaeon]|nr:hypothetical protein [Methanoregulaceae archaeon]
MRLLRLLPLLALVGCAKLPETPVGAAGTRLAFTITLAREVNENYVYMVALRPSTDPNPPEQGPIPVIAPPWGNGFVAGTVTHFVSWANIQSPRYLLYRFRDAALIDYFALGAPVNYVDVLPGGKVLRFEIDLTQIAPSAAVAETYQSLQFNILTNDRIPQGGAGTKNWDALGDGRLPSEINTPITISLRTSGTYDNARYFDLEPNGDVADPDLDIVDWKVEVRRL